MFLIA